MEEKKKIKIGTIINIIAIIAVVVFAVILFSNNGKLNKLNNEMKEIKGTDKKAITAEEFKNIIAEKNFTINVPKDVYTDEFIEQANIENGYLTKEIEDEEYRINFFEFKDENSELYLYYKEIYTTRSGSNGNIKETIEKSMNHTRYTAITNGKYVVLSRIGNTLIWGTINEDKKQNLIDLLNEIGY